MRSPRLHRLPWIAGLGLGLILPATASATDRVHDHDEHVEVVVEDDDEVVEIHDHHDHHDHDRHHAHTRWFGVHFGALTTPLSPSGQIRAGNKVTSNPFKACLDPFSERHCSAIRGFDVRVQYYETHGAWDYPRWVGYFRTGYGAGRADFRPTEEGGHGLGETKSLAYYSVPLFLGGNVYLFKRSPVRPYGGLGFGFDVVKLHYRQAGGGVIDDVSARIGFELHAGLEVRISNVVALTGEVMQLWSAKRKIDSAPDFSNTGLTVMTGIAVSIPTPGSGWGRDDHRHHGHHHHVRRVVKTKKAPAPTPAPAPVIVAPAPAPAPAPVHVEVEQHVTTPAAPAAPAPVVVAPAPEPAPVVVVPGPEPAPVVVTPPPAPAPVVVTPPAPAPPAVVVTPAAGG